jgi:hypothetical protein
MPPAGVACFDSHNTQVGYVVWSPKFSNWIWYAWPKGRAPIIGGGSATQGREATLERAKAQVVAALALNEV